MKDSFELETKVWWLKFPLSLDKLQQELSSCIAALKRSQDREWEDDEEGFGVIPYEQELRRKIECLEWDIERWPRPV